MQITEKSILTILKESSAQAISYVGYRELVQSLVNAGKSTGPIQTETYVHYTALNHRRMKRWDKMLQLDQQEQNTLQQLDHGVTWLVLTESWCGDAAPALPVMNALAQHSSYIDLKILLRDEHPELMEHFLTKGAMSIPKLIQWEPSSKKVTGTWGPRSAKATELVTSFKAQNGQLTPEFREDLQKWYNMDKGKSIKTELLELLFSLE